ncbi:MAG: di-heme enzyme [Labilithrix sp.]|nr:di-heme enzyme [Labilithrix sp.]MCW5836811.1 di-heme enzyme [Labilithrix sp.]
MRTASLTAAVAVAAALGGAAGACGEDSPGPAAAGPTPSEHDASAEEGGVDAEPPPDAGAEPDGGFVWELPAWFPRPVVPADNPMSAVKVELGRHLFYDTRLSLNRSQSCASCHEQKRAFTDGRAQSLGSTGEEHPRNAMALANVGYVSTLTWANPLLLTLEQQTVVPIFGDEPVELGMRNREGELLARLSAEARYQVLFPRAFPGDPAPVSVGNVVKAISAFERTLVSGNSPFDRFSHGGEADAISASAKRGHALFNSERLECFHCHNGFNLMDSTNYEGKSAPEVRFHNTGLYNVGGTGAYPAPNRGVMEITANGDDMGRFRAQSLRNVAVTAPYMHDGSVATLDEALDHYAAAGRTIAAGPNAGVGSQNPYKSSLVIGFELTPGERADVLAFLHALTDDEFLTAPRFASPWGQPCPLCE